MERVLEIRKPIKHIQGSFESLPINYNKRLPEEALVGLSRSLISFCSQLIPYLNLTMNEEYVAESQICSCIKEYSHQNIVTRNEY